jgi:ATP adenylyltransferase
MRKYLFNTEKLKYVTGRQKPDVDCILCAVRDRSEKVSSLELYRNGLVMATVNLYPFNPGHLMIFPLRHVEDITDLSAEEAAAVHELTVKTVSLLREEFNPTGFNLGYNLGKSGGASISHIHQHIVPRYDNELGFIDVLGGARIMVVDPNEVMERLKKRFAAL